MSTGGSTSMPDMSLALQLLAQSIDESLKATSGERTPWALVLQIGNVAHYVSNCNRPDGLDLVEDMLVRWRAEEATK